jgi:hypothetical protein
LFFLFRLKLCPFGVPRYEGKPRKNMKGDKKKQEESRTPWKETQHPKWAKRRQESDMKGDKRKLGSVEGGHSISHKGGHTLKPWYPVQQPKYLVIGWSFHPHMAP